MSRFAEPDAKAVSRREFVRTAGAFGAIAAVDRLLPSYARSHGELMTQRAVAPHASYDLVIAETRIQVAGRATEAVTINGNIPGPLLELREGEDAVIRVVNRLREDTSIHWHGVLVPEPMDGVPGVSFPGIAGGQTFEYRFPVRQSGTYWYHSHSGLQEQSGHYGPLLIRPNDGYPYAFDREFTIVLSDWTYENPYRVLDRLKKQGSYYNNQRRTLGDFFRDVGRNGLMPTVRERMMWLDMRMDPTDIHDVTGASYTYLVNGLAPGSNWTGVFTPGEKVLLHVINAAADTYFDVRIPGAAMTVVQSDGQYVEPVETDEFRIAIAETYDVILTPDNRPYTFFAESMDRSGYARGTLTPRSGWNAPIPERRPRPLLSMGDMGMDMQGMAGMSGMSGMHGADSTARAPAKTTTMPGMDHSSHGASSSATSMSGMPSDTTGDRARYAIAGMSRTSGLRPPGTLPGMLEHEPGRHGVDNAAVPMMVTSRLSEPGLGLGDDGWRVLRYTQLRAFAPRAEFRAPTREIEMHLTGNMERFMWSIDGVPFEKADTVRINYGERIRLTMVNDTMMNHPMHLHGMFMELENGQGDRIPYAHTVNVKPAERLSLLFTADAPGRWAFHCHILYHMEVGMFRVFEVSQPGKPFAIDGVHDAR